MKWEYRIISLGVDPKPQEDTLNSWGLSGWELINVVYFQRDGVDFIRAYFKRPIK